MAMPSGLPPRGGVQATGIRTDDPGRRTPVLPRRLASAAPVALTVAIGLLVGTGVTYVALRPDAAGSSVDGAPSVQTIDRPAGAASTPSPSAEAILADATLAATSAGVDPANEPPNARAALTEF